MSVGSKKHYIANAFIVVCSLSIKLKNLWFLDICL